MSTSKQNVPILNLQAQYESIQAELESTILEVLRSGNYVLGKYVTKLEEEVATVCDAKFGIGVANGTDALHLALWGLDIGEGDEVITSPFTFAATVEAILMMRATPVFVDINPDTFNIDPTKIEAAITPRTKAIIPVHLYGQPADMEQIMKIAEAHSLKVIEDNAQAIGANYRGRMTGSFGDCACISFYPTKNLGACGDAGMIVTNNEELANRLKALRAHGMTRRYYHDELGVNSRLDELQAAALVAKLPYLSKWNKRRNEIADRYNELLANCPQIVLPKRSETASLGSGIIFTHVWHQYTIRVVSDNYGNKLSNGARQTLLDTLAKADIGSMCYYPVPMHMQKPFAGDYKYGDFPESEKAAAEVLSLPMYPELTDEQVVAVAEAVNKAMAEASAGVTISTPVSTPFPAV